MNAPESHEHHDASRQHARDPASATPFEPEHAVDGLVPDCAATWPVPASPVELVPGNVHLWRARLNVSDDAVAAFASILSDDERKRAAAFRVPAGRRRFVVCRGTLRHILARYCEMAPAAVCFRYTPTGKPELEQRGAVLPIRFNVSHSHELAMYAITGDRAVGVDIERVRPIPEWEHLAERLFSVWERMVLQECGAEERDRAFLMMWTRMEARLKATGAGLSGSVRNCDTGAALAPPAGRTAPDSRLALRLVDVVPAAGYIGALGVSCHRAEQPGVTLWQAPTWFST